MTFLLNLTVINSATVQHIGDCKLGSYIRKTMFVNMSVTSSYSLMFVFTGACFDSSFLFDSLESVII